MQSPAEVDSHWVYFPFHPSLQTAGFKKWTAGAPLGDI